MTEPAYTATIEEIHPTDFHRACEVCNGEGGHVISTPTPWEEEGVACERCEGTGDVSACDTCDATSLYPDDGSGRQGRVAWLVRFPKLQRIYCDSECLMSDLLQHPGYRYEVKP